MDLTFNKTNKGYVAEFEATSDFNLHVERKGEGAILLYQRTQGNGWDMVDGFGARRHQTVIDSDFTALVFPKQIKVLSETEITMGVVTFAE